MAIQLDLEHQPAPRIVDRLLEVGFVERVANPRSLKSHKISLTARGRAAFDRVLEKEGKILRQVARKVKADELEVTLRLITQVTAAFALKRGRRPPMKGSSP